MPCPLPLLPIDRFLILAFAAPTTLDRLFIPHWLG